MPFPWVTLSMHVAQTTIFMHFISSIFALLLLVTVITQVSAPLNYSFMHTPRCTQAQFSITQHTLHCSQTLGLSLGLCTTSLSITSFSVTFDAKYLKQPHFPIVHHPVPHSSDSHFHTSSTAYLSVLISFTRNFVLYHPLLS